MKIRGHIDRSDTALIEGWITLIDATGPKIGLEFVLGEKVIGRCVADQFRDDLKQADLGEGACAFSFPVPAFIPKSEIARVVVRLEDSNVILPADHGSRYIDVPVAETVSRFGGLWIDRSDWLDRLAAKHRLGAISDTVADWIFRFARDGFLIIPEAVSPDYVDLVNADIERAWQAPPRGLMVETFEPAGEMRIVPPDLTLRAGRTKMLDLFVHSAVVRGAIAAPKVLEFLSAIFEDQPKAFQSLTFWNGSQQAIHKDTAYVKIDSNPMHLAATWLALEDISPGTGELEYYIGSHRALDFLFGGSSKWMESHSEDHERFLNSLHADAKRLGHVRGSFLAKKGDVLVWHADLAHGGLTITSADRNRRSLVTHFTSSSDEPFYRRDTQHDEANVFGCRFVSQFGDVRG